MKFGYYARLTAKQKATYRKSDEIPFIPIPDVVSFASALHDLETSLASGRRVATAKSLSFLLAALCRALEAPPVKVKVRLVRPAIDGGELHGLYRFPERGKLPVIEVWMKTAAHEKVVRFRTFLRTALHEIVHHHDVTVLGLDDSFHTQGFFRRESSLLRQLLPPRTTARREASRTAPRPRQLGLFEALKPPGSA